MRTGLWQARLTAALLLVGLPLATGWLAGFPPGFTELPASRFHLEVPRYSAPLYALLAALMLASATLYAAPRRLGFSGRAGSKLEGFDWALAPEAGKRFPAWGWAGIGLIAAAWPAAWTHPAWLGPAADNTFFPLWLGYILAVDGLVYRRAAASPLTRYGFVWLAWFPASALVWWYFELLNRFVQNWLYLGVDAFSTLRYVLTASAGFSTVIPAVLTTAALLSTLAPFRRRFVRPGTGETRHGAHLPPGACWLLVAVGATGLALMPWFPVALFALIWVAPWLILVGLLERAGLATGAGHLWRGDWRPMLTLAAAAFICGLFWEMWNFYAMPKWVYQIPWVNRYKVFEMPLVGYLGYLPFGPACWAFWLLLGPERVRRGEA